MENSPFMQDLLSDENMELDEIYPVVYEELRRLAGYYMRQERGNHTLQPTALVHEAYLRMLEQEKGTFLNRTQFIAVAANMMRRILVNYAVRRKRQKREGDFIRVTLDRAVDSFNDDALNLIALDEALHDLAKIDERSARVFELRFFGGLTVEETAEVLEISRATVKREWTYARAFLQSEMFG